MPGPSDGRLVSGIDSSYFPYPHTAKVDAADRIVVGGRRLFCNPGCTFQVPFVARFTSAGALDTTFDSDGHFEYAPAGIFGLGHGAGAHAPDEYWLVESANPKVAGMDGSARSFVDLF